MKDKKSIVNVILWLIAKMIFYPCWILEIYFTYGITDVGKVKMRFCRADEFMDRITDDFKSKTVVLIGVIKSEDLYGYPYQYRLTGMKLAEI